MKALKLEEYDELKRRKKKSFWLECGEQGKKWKYTILKRK